MSNLVNILFNPFILIIIFLICSIFFLILCRCFFSKNINFLSFCITLFLQFLAIYLWIMYDPFLYTDNYNHGFQFFVAFLNNNWLGFNLIFGIDGFALVFIELTIFIFTLCFFATNNIKKYTAIFFINLFILELLLILIFSILDIFLFYIFFESSLIPMFFIVGFWGSRSRRIKAVFYLFMYTMTTALLTLIGIFYIVNQVGSTFYPDLLYYNFNTFEQKILWVFFFLTFATKIPMVPFHLWLPEAHVEAPTIGSVILASILLKLGGFGFIRYLIPLFPVATNFFLPFVFTLGIISVIFASLTTLRQLDLKRIIAYSSIAHMNMVVLGLFAINENALDGAMYLMIGHGIVSSALFFSVGVIYDRFHTRLLRYYSGLVQVMPLFGIFFLLFTLGNIGFPLTSNFIGESLIVIGIFIKNPFVAVLSGFGIIFAAVYSFWLYNRVFFTTLQVKYFLLYNDINRKEFFIAFPLLFIMFYIGLSSTSILIMNLINIKTFFFNFQLFEINFPTCIDDDNDKTNVVIDNKAATSQEGNAEDVLGEKKTKSLGAKTEFIIKIVWITVIAVPFLLITASTVYTTLNGR